MRLVLVAEPAEPVVGSLVVELLVELVACLVALWLALLLATTVLVGPWGEAARVAGVWQRLVGAVGAAANSLASLAWGAAQKPSLVPVVVVEWDSWPAAAPWAAGAWRRDPGPEAAPPLEASLARPSRWFPPASSLPSPGHLQKGPPQQCAA